MDVQWAATTMTTAAARTSRWVTSRVREALAASSNTELLKALVEAFPGSWFFTRLDGTFAFVNQHACDVLGYTREELMALTLYDVDPALTPAIWKELLSVGNFIPASIRTVHRRKDGSTYPVEAFGSRIILGDENVAVSYVIDLSEEAQTRQELAEKQHLLQSLLDNAPVIVWSVGSNGRFQLSEGSALSLLGLQPGQVVGKTVAEEFPRLRDIAEATERALRGEPVEGVVSLEKHDFEYRYLPQRDDKGDVIGATGVAIDVTARHKAEHSNRRLMTAIEQTDASILLLDPKGTIEYANKAFESIWHVSKRDAPGRALPELLPEEESARAELACAISDGVAWRGTLRLQGPEGNECIAQTTLSPVLEANGRLTGFVAVIRDVTLQARTEERLRQVEKMDAVGQLAGGVAHDFNNLLQVIMGNVDLCMNADSLEGARAGLAEIREAGKRAAGLVSQLLTFSRNVGIPTSVDLLELIVRLMPILRRLLGEHILVEVQKDEDHLEVWGDESQLEQIIVNLCVNARDAMPEGGRLDLRLFARPILDDQAVHLGLSGAGRYVVIEVRDTGCGMTEEVQRRAFEPFFTTKAPGVGTGLGLATVYGVAKRHGGTVELESAPGAGSCFRVFLRASHRVGKVAQQPVQPLAKAARPLRILLAEDDASVREVTRKFLIQAGHDVTVASTGVEAMRLFDLESARFELLILDAIMPGANGPEVLRRFRACSGAPVLFVTGHDFDVLSGVTMDGTWSVLRKPFNADDLAAAISKLNV